MMYVSIGGMVTATAIYAMDFAWDTSTANLTDQRRSLCALDCFAAGASHSTVPYYTLDTQRNITLGYTEDRVHPRPVLYTDIQQLGAGAPFYTLQATINSAAVTFLNGDQVLYFSDSSSASLRLAGQFDASSYTTGIYPVTVTVTGLYGPLGNKSHSYTVPLVIVNEARSPVAKGWTTAGLQRLYFTNSEYLITDGTGDAVVFP